MSLLPKQERIVREKEIQQVLKKGIRSQEKYFKLTFASVPNSPFRLLVIVSKKVAKKSVTRHAIKRKISSVFVHLKQTQRLPLNLACIVQVTNSTILTVPYPQLELELREALSRLFQKITSKPK